ncbi:MAG: DUF3810 domain-containing protein [Bacteroidales bacterium]|nr:DUF3810 domain-containing protein [Bacteroidales bacterium]
MVRERRTMTGMGAGLAVLLLIPVIYCRHNAAAADFYATRIYPGISAALSFIASPFGFSLTELVVVAAIAVFIWLIIKAFARHEKWWKWLLSEVLLLVWVYIWFYGAWGINYSRSSLYSRAGAAPMPYEEAEFHEFLQEFAEQLNGNWCPPEAFAEIGREAVEPHVKAWYSALPPESGLCKPRGWQHPKKPVFNRMYSGVGVLGFLGPAFDEMHINTDITPLEYPFVFAHEYAHVLGVSSEAEANFWAFELSRASDNKAVRYSAWYSLLSFTWRNIQSLLDEEDFKAWVGSLRPEIIDDLERTQEHWQGMRWTAIAKMQKWIYDLFLRSNNIAEGTRNYGQVLRLVLTFSDLHSHEDGEEG